MLSTSKQEKHKNLNEMDFINNPQEEHAIFKSSKAQESFQDSNTKYQIPEALHKDQVLNEYQIQPQINKESFFKKYIKNPSNRNIAISTFNAVLHGLATISEFGESEQMKSFNRITNTTAFFFTRWLAPIVTYGSAALNSFKKNDPIEMFIKLIPPILLPFTGDSNVDTIYGLSSALNQPYDMASKRIRDNAHLSEDHKNFSENKGSFSKNMSLIFDSLKSLYHDLGEGKLNFMKQATHLIGCPLIFASSLPMAIFARQDRNSNFARTLGLARNIGGILGDIGFMAGENLYKKSIGVLFMTAALSSIAKRWVDEKTSRVFIHLASALDLSAYSIWNAYSESIEKINAKQNSHGNLTIAA